MHKIIDNSSVSAIVDLISYRQGQYLCNSDMYHMSKAICHIDAVFLINLLTNQPRVLTVTVFTAGQPPIQTLQPVVTPGCDCPLVTWSGGVRMAPQLEFAWESGCAEPQEQKLTVDHTPWCLLTLLAGCIFP